MSDHLHDTPFHNLSPELVIDAVESTGLLSDLRVMALNSYENRVYQIGIEGEEPIIAKFYRPERWTDEQIQEEHEFMFQLKAAEVPVIATKKINQKSLFFHEGHRFCLYPRRGGHAPELDKLETLFTLGQHLGRIHAIGATQKFAHRPMISLQTFAVDSREFLLENNFLPHSLEDSYAAITEQLIDKTDDIFASTQVRCIRLHGDCHPGNILQRDDSLWFVDFDDARSGPAIQDLWMMLSGDLQDRRSQLEAILEGYEEFYDFEYAELRLIESLRVMRLIHHAAWLAKRWQDPAFPQAFPWFNTESYWGKHILDLREQFSALEEPTIKVGSAI